MSTGRNRTPAATAAPQLPLALLLLHLGVQVASAATCPDGATELARFNDTDDRWVACEDLSRPDGAISLVREDSAEVVWLPKTHAPYTQGSDSEYYLRLGKQAVLNGSKSRDVLGSALLSCNYSSAPDISCFSWRDVALALPPIRYSGSGGHWPSWEGCDGVRSFVGSRSTSTDATFSDYGEDCSKNGFPSPLGQSLPGYSVINWTAVNSGEGAILNWSQYVNFSAVADGLVGGDLPVLALYFPILPENPYHTLQQGSARYWTMIAAPLADPELIGRREQDVWFRFTQIDCKTSNGAYGYGKCSGKQQFWQNYWWSRLPGRSEHGTAFGPEVASGAADFYRNLLRVRRYWTDVLNREGMMALSLPESVHTNGTWLNLQATHSIIRTMITRRETWHPSYGVSPGYGWQGQDGFQDTFTTTATMALEWGAMNFARGVIDNQFQFYIRAEDGMVNYRATEVPCSSRFLTILALYYSYSADASLLLKHFEKARKLAGWLLYRRKLSLSFPESDPRHGIPFGNDEADTYAHVGGFSGSGHAGPGSNQPEPLWSGIRPRNHDLSSAAEMSRAFEEMGTVWVTLGKSHQRDDLIEHGKELLATAPLLVNALHASLNRTVVFVNTGTDRTSSPRRCWAHSGETGCGGWHVRAYPEMMYSAQLTREQVEDIYNMGAGVVDCSGVRNCSDGEQFLQVGAPAGGSLIFTHIPFGLAYGLLAADFPDRFLLHYLASSAHSYTRGSMTTPESSFLDRDSPSIAYASAGQTIAAMYLRWALAYEDVRSKTVWIAKALPREWLAPSLSPVIARNVTTRYGRVSFSMHGQVKDGTYSAHAIVSLPTSWTSLPPPGGLRVRFRAPLHVGKVETVRVDGNTWTAFDPQAESIDFSKKQLTVMSNLHLAIVVIFGKQAGQN